MLKPKKIPPSLSLRELIWGDSHLDFCAGQDIKCRIPKNTSHTSVTLRHLFPPISHRPSYNQGLHVSSTTCKSVWCQDFTAWLGSGGVCVRHTVFPEVDPHPLLSGQSCSFVAQSGILTMHRRKWCSTFPRFPLVWILGWLSIQGVWTQYFFGGCRTNFGYFSLGTKFEIRKKMWKQETIKKR